MNSKDPIAVIDSLDVDAIRGRLTDLRQQEDALRILLRAALARQRDRAAIEPTHSGGVEARHAR
jgi:hypothetical protein